MSERRRSIKDDLKELEELRQRLYKNQGRNTTKEAGDKVGSKAMKAEGTSNNFKEGGYPTNTKADGSKYQGAPSSKSHLQGYKDAQSEQTKFKKPPRRATGREEMIAERYMSQRQKKEQKQSAIVGD